MDNNEDRINRIRNRISKITDALKDYVPEISGAAVGAAFGNPVVGAVIGTAAKRLLNRFLEAKKKPMNISPEMQKNIERYTNATIIATGTAKKIEQQEVYTLQKESNGFYITASEQTAPAFFTCTTANRSR